MPQGDSERALDVVGNVLDGHAGRINLRSFDGAFFSRFFPLEAAASGFRADRLFAYAKTEGGADLRETIARLAGLSPEDIVVTDGASQALFLWMLAGLRPGDRILVPRPAFPAYLRLATYCGRAFAFYESRADGADLLEKLEPSGGAPPAAVILNSPHNPTGITVDRELAERIVERAAKAGCLVVFDDAYAWLEQPIGQVTRLGRFARNAWPGARLAAVGSLGKILCLPGLRLGFIATCDQALRDEIVEAKRHLVQASCPASEELAATLLVSPPWMAARLCLLQALDARRAGFERIARRLGARPVTGACGFYAYASQVGGLTGAGVDGIPGPIFEAHGDEARYCLAAAESHWSDFEALTPPR